MKVMQGGNHLQRHFQRTVPAHESRGGETSGCN